MTPALFQRELYAEMKASLDAVACSVPTISNTLLNQVVGAGGTPDGFLYGGFTTALGIRATLKSLGVTLSSSESLLDFGCGPGRVLRWFVHSVNGVWGVDVNEEAVQWCRETHPDARIIQNTPSPPLPIRDGTFDVVLAVSVLTHLNEQHQLAWLREIRRILQPNGLLLATVHGRNKARRELNPTLYADFLKRGFVFYRPDDRGTLDRLPEFYQVAFHSRDYVDRTWTRLFEPLLCVSHGPAYEQELFVLRNKRGRRVSTRVHRLPCACIDTPRAGVAVSDDQVNVSGWAFFHDRRGPVPLDVWLDGEHVGGCATKHIRPDVVATFRSRHAELSGFSTVIPIQATTESHHAVWLTTGLSPVPLAATFFRTVMPE